MDLQLFKKQSVSKKIVIRLTAYIQIHILIPSLYLIELSNSVMYTVCCAKDFKTFPNKQINKD